MTALKNILICNQKGGVGKSLIADELAFSFERSGIPVSFYDLDSQGGTIHTSREPADARAAVIDTPGALRTQMRDWLAGADVIVIPTRTTSRDIEPLLRMRMAVQAAGRSDRVLYVFNAWNRWRASSDFLDWFRTACGDVPLCTLPQSEQFVRAGAAGVSVVEYARRGAAVRATVALCGAVRTMAGFPVEKHTVRT